jgi:hypothetical protein
MTCEVIRLDVVESAAECGVRAEVGDDAVVEELEGCTRVPRVE